MATEKRVPRLVTANGFRSSRYFDIGITGRLEDLLVDAEEVIEARLDGRRLSVTEYAEQSRPVGVTVFTVNRPIVEVTAVRVRNGPRGSWRDIPPADVAVFKREGYLELPGNLEIGREVQVAYRAGLDPMPGPIKQAVYLQAALLAFQDIEMYGGGDGKEPGLAYNDKGIDQWLKPFRQSSLAHPNASPVAIFRSPYESR